MVLGGYFLVARQPALTVNGFDIMFDGYGFTETTLPTKLIAIQEHYVIPQVVGGAIHCQTNPAHHSQYERDMFFRRAHTLYFDTYLKLSVVDAPTRPIQGWIE